MAELPEGISYPPVWGTGGDVLASQQSSGGNPGAFLQITTNPDGRPGGSGTSSRVAGVFLNNNAVYDPESSGPILNVDFSEQIRFLISAVIPFPHNG